MSHHRRLEKLEEAIPRDGEDLCIQCRPGGVRAFLDAYWARVRAGEEVRDQDDARSTEEVLAYIRELRAHTPRCTRCGR